MVLVGSLCEYRIIQFAERGTCVYSFPVFLPQFSTKNKSKIDGALNQKQTSNLRLIHMKYLVAVDGSLYAKAAFYTALALAQKNQNAELYIMTVVDELETHWQFSLPFSMMTDESSVQLDSDSFSFTGVCKTKDSKKS